MPDTASPLDTLLRLGEQIAEAVEGEEWERLSQLVHERTRVARRLGQASTGDGAPAESPAEREEKVQALAAQYERLNTLLGDQRTQVEEELAELDRLKNARDSYGASAPRQSILKEGLKG